MIVSTTTAIDGRPVTDYVGVVTGEAVLAANVFRDLFAGLRDIVGGRSAGYERSLRQARETAIGEMVAEVEQIGARRRPYLLPEVKVQLLLLDSGMPARFFAPVVTVTLNLSLAASNLFGSDG